MVDDEKWQDVCDTAISRGYTEEVENIDGPEYYWRKPGTNSFFDPIEGEFFRFLVPPAFLSADSRIAAW